jgi:hypothetical protein
VGGRGFGVGISVLGLAVGILAASMLANYSQAKRLKIAIGLLAVGILAALAVSSAITALRPELVELYPMLDGVSTLLRVSTPASNVALSILWGLAAGFFSAAILLMIPRERPGR